MGCYCDRRKGGAGKINTPYSYHLYICELYMDEFYSYEEFLLEYNLIKHRSSTEIYNYFWNKHYPKDFSESTEIQSLIDKISNLKF